MRWAELRSFRVKRLRNAAATEVQPSSLAPNPEYKAPEALAALTFAGAKIDIAKWKFRKLVPLTQSGAQQIELDLDLLAHASPNQGDVRLVREERQIPFLLERTSISRQIQLNATPANDPKRPALLRLVAPAAANCVADHAGCLHICFTAFPSGNAVMGRSHGRAR